MKFTLKIELGNEAMQTDIDVAGALKEVSDRLSNGHKLSKDDYGNIRDLNGDTVGAWKVTR